MKAPGRRHQEPVGTAARDGHESARAQRAGLSTSEPDRRLSGADADEAIVTAVEWTNRPTHRCKVERPRRPSGGQSNSRTLWDGRDHQRMRRAGERPGTAANQVRRSKQRPQRDAPQGRWPTARRARISIAGARADSPGMGPKCNRAYDGCRVGSCFIADRVVGWRMGYRRHGPGIDGQRVAETSRGRTTSWQGGRGRGSGDENSGAAGVVTSGSRGRGNG